MPRNSCGITSRRAGSNCVGLPLFPSGDDPGPRFAALLRRTDPTAALLPGTDASSGALTVRHGTTVVALRHGQGVLRSAGRRATELRRIPHRPMEKFFPADRHSAVAIAGAAGPA